MSGLPGVKTTILDNQLGTVAPYGDGSRVIVGVCSLGVAGQVYALTDLDAVPSLLGNGPLAEAVLESLAVGGGLVYAVPATASVQGGVTPVEGNPNAPAVGLAGASAEALDVQVTMTAGGAVGTAQFTVSLDGGDNVSGPILTAAEYAIPGTAHKLTFAAGNYAQGTVYNFAVTAPQASMSDIVAAVQPVLDGPLLYDHVLIAQPGDIGLWTALDQLGVSAHNDYREVTFINAAPMPNTGESVDQWVQRLAAISFQSKYVNRVAFIAETIHPTTGRSQVRSTAARLSGRLASRPVSEEMGWIGGGTITGVVVAAPFLTGPTGKTALFRNGHALTLDQAGYTTGYTQRGRDGYFWVQANTSAPSTSDFRRHANKRVMDKAVTLVRLALLDDVQASTDPTDLAGATDHMVAKGNAALGSMVANRECVGGSVSVPPGQNILSDSTLRVKVRVTPFGYPRDIALEVGFLNPYLKGANA